MFFIFFITLNSIATAILLRKAYIEHRSDNPNKDTPWYLIVAAINFAVVIAHIVGLSSSP